MKKLEWVKWYPEKFLNGVGGMSIDQIGVYAMVLNLIYESGGSIEDDRDTLARRCGSMRPTSFDKTLEQLIRRNKLVVRDGRISNPRAEEELEARKKVHETWKANFNGSENKLQENDKENNVTTYPSEGAPASARGGSKRTVEKESVEKERKKDSMSSSRKAKTAQEIGYTEEFETKVWQPYPRKRGTSKFKAFQLWRMLTEERQRLVMHAIPIHAKQMQLEGRADDKIKHLQFFISERVYETYGVLPAESNVMQIPWHKTATREQWARALKVYENDSNWRNAWGPAPGFDGCTVPQDLIDALPYHLHPKSDPRFRSHSRQPKNPEAEGV